MTNSSRAPLLTGLFCASQLWACVVRVNENDDDATSRRAPGAGAAARDGSWEEPAEIEQEPPVDSAPDQPAPEGTDLSGRYQSLIVTDPAVLSALSSPGDLEAPASFASMMTFLADDEAAAPGFALDWFDSWAAGDAKATARPGARALARGWLSGDPEEQPSGDAGVDGGTASEPRSADYADAPTATWENAPFYLIAIVNRVDLAGEPCAGFAGELRFVFAAEDGRYGEALDLTLIVEIPLPTTVAAADWGRRFAELDGLDDIDLGTRLASIVTDVTSGANALQARIRTNDAALGEAGDERWQLREFRPAIFGTRLVATATPLEFTPSDDADPASLATHILDNADAIRQRPVPLPPELQATVASIADPEFRWQVPGVNDALVDAFSSNTCNGCHGGNARTLPFQHVAPGSAHGAPARLSPFLYDPEAPADELSRRAARLEDLAGTECAPSPGPDPY